MFKYSRNSEVMRRRWCASIFTNPDGTPREVLGIQLKDWGRILLCLVGLYLFLGLFYAGLVNIAIEVRKERWLLLADDFYGPFERVDRFLIDPTTGDKIEALEPPEDITISPKEIIYRKFNRPDGCVEAIKGSDSVEVMVCDESGTKSGNRWTLYPWIADLAKQSDLSYENPACSFTESGTTILQTNGLAYGLNTCVNGVTVLKEDLAR